MSDQSQKRPNPDETTEERMNFFTFLKTRRWARILLVTVLAAALVGTGIAAAYDKVLDLMDSSILADSKNNTEDDDGVLDAEIGTKPEEQEKHMNILLCGVDYKKNTGRGKLTDVMMVIHMDFVEQTMDILQLPRDSYIGKDYSTGKLNAIYGSTRNGGIENLARRINQMLQIPLDYYVLMDMNGFEDIVDAIGGVTVDSPYSFKLEGVTIVKGVQTLDGRAANKFVRERHAYATGDLERMKMQQIFLKAFVNKCLSLGKDEILKLAPKIFQYLTTDMTLNQGLAFYSQFSDIQLSALQFHSCEVSAFTDPYDGLSKLSLHAKPLADMLNTYFRENGEKVNWTELGILEYVTNYSYEGEQEQYVKEETSSESGHAVSTSSQTTSSRPASSQKTFSRPASSQTTSRGESSSSQSSATVSSDTTSESEETSSAPEVSEPESETTSEPESESEQTSSETSSEQPPVSSEVTSSAESSEVSEAVDDPQALRSEETTSDTGVQE